MNVKSFIHQILYFCIGLFIIFFQILPLQTTPQSWSGPNVLLVFFAAIVIKRPARRRSRIRNHLQWIRKNLQFIFFKFLMILNGFFWHGALGYISIFTVDAKKTHPFTFLYRLQLFSKANFLT